MALTDRNIIIVPNIGTSNLPTMNFVGADASNSATIALSVSNAGTVGTLSYSGASSQILSLSDGSTAGSGIVTVAGTTDTGSATLGSLRVAGGVGIAKSLFVGGSGTFTSNLTVLGTLNATVNTATNAANAYGVVVQDVSALGNQYFPTMVQNNTGSQPLYDAAFNLSFYPNSAQLLVGSVNASAFSQVTGLFAAQRNRDSAIQLANTGTVALTNAGGAVIIGAANASGASLQFYTYTGQIGAESAGEKMRIHTNGYVGVNQSSPLARLHIGGNTNNAAQAILTTYGGDGNFQLVAFNANNSTNAAGAEVARFGLSYAQSNTTNFGAGFAFYRGGGAPDGSLAVLTNNTEAIRVNSSQLVGINNTTPQTKLDVAYEAGINTTTPATTLYNIHLTPSSRTAGNAVGITFGADTSSGQNAQAGIYSQFSGSYGTRMYLATTDSYASGAKTRITILETGLVAIGTVITAAPTGTTMGSGLVVNGNQGASTTSMVLQRGGSNGLAFNVGSNTTGDTLVYDWAGGSWNINLNLAYGKLMVGSSGTPQARFSVASTTGTAGSVGAWANAHATFGPNVTSQTGAALGLAYNTTSDQAEILSLAPSVAWKPLNIFSTDLILSSNTASEIARFNGTGLQFVSGQTLLKFANLTSSTAADGITWYSPSPQVYGIYKTAGTWASPNYQQLQAKWDTGIIIDGSNGQNYGLSGLMLQPNGGNVSIGLQTKAMSRLTVYKTGTSTISTADASSTAHLTLAGTDSLVRLQFGTLNAAPYAGWIQASYDNGGGANGVEPLLLNPGGGNVQIGITADQGYKLYVSGTARVSGNFYAPIFYDSDNTAYYSDPAGTSNLNTVIAANQIGDSTNYATSQGWVAGQIGDQVGYFGGNFTLNGANAENLLAYGTDPFGRRSLLWGARNNDVASNDDGGWNKTMSQGISYTKSYMSVVYVRRNGTSTNGTFYHGCDGGNTLNISDNSANGNPYFGPIGIGGLPQDVWCVSIGTIHAYSDGTTSSTSGSGLYRLDTGQKIASYTDYKMSNGATQQVHRVYLYYSTDPAASIDWWGTGFWEINGNEPSVDSLVGNVNTGWTRNAYAPYYFDTANTGYYMQPSATSNMYAATLPKLFLNRSGVTGSGISWYSSGYTAWTDYMAPAGSTGNGPTANITAPSGTYVTSWGRRSFIENLSGYGWTWEGGSATGNPTVLAEIRATDGAFRSTSSVTAAANMYSPIYYDLDNSSYFADPAGRSRFSTLDFGNGSYYVGAGDWGIRNTTPYGWIQLGPANSGHAHIYTDRSNFYFNVNDLYTNGNWVMTENYQQSGKYHGSDGSIRAYIFYDNNDTGYYVDPNGTSRTYATIGALQRYGSSGNVNTDFQNTPAGTMRHGGDDYGLSNAPGTGGWHFYDHYRHSNGSNYWGTQVAWGWEDNANNMYQRNISANSFSGWVKYWNTGHQLQSTIFYDANNTGYYVDPNGTSQLQIVYGTDFYITGWFRNTGGAQGLYNQTYANHWYSDSSNYYNVAPSVGIGSGIGIRIRDGYAGTVKGYFYADNSGVGILNDQGGWSVRTNYGSGYGGTLYNSWTSSGDHRAPIFYDSNDTGYYVDPNGAYNTNLQGVTSYSLMRMGLTYKYNTARSDYTGDSNYWVGNKGWGTTDFNTFFMWGCGFIDSWSNPGNQPSGTSHWETIQAMHYNNGSTGYGWQMTNGAGTPELTYIRGIWGGGFTSWYKVALYENNSNAARAFYASIYYDADNTGYYCNPAGSTPFNFLANGRVTLTANDSGYLVTNAEGSGSNVRLGCAWGRPGIYNGSYITVGSESYIEFVTGNVQRAYVDSSNNLISNGSSRGTIFYDQNNTGYYVDPNGGSYIENMTMRQLYFTGVGGDSGAGNPAYAIYQVPGGWGYPYPDLGIGYHTGIRIGAYYGYNGTRFYNNHDWSTQIGSFGDGDNNLRSYYDIIAYASDRRLKENIRPIENAVAKVRTITGMVFDWKDMVRDLGFEPNAKTEVGVFAQDVEAVLPEAVTVAPFDYDWKKPGQSISGERYLTVKYEKLVPLLIQAIKEQQDQLDELRELIKGLTDANL